MAEQVKAGAALPDDPSLISGSRGGMFQLVPDLYMNTVSCLHICTCTSEHVHINK